ncbi:hypothetical protein HYPSUDRAFT_74565 [Hypholoma sublateritium FD-334 SS-4]|uniref:Leo1-like protein n=1 Tax=Hypholoma sublateritium (strain FD-334 SS-4) TaxID=945553 RepID=A0A0D2LKD3_HYPSF|nr:hypothetical protein HYPSUDRAFT_74565 [Hypholoma sublateritium FD-334 SS-4]
MSSLAGALDLQPSTRPSEDIDMTSEDEDAAMSDLFGNDNDARPAPASPSGSGPDSERLPSPERERRQALEYEEDDAPPEIAIEVKEAEVKFPNLPVPKPSDGDNWVIRMPNYVKVDSKPFHPDSYIGPEHDDDEGLHDAGRETSMTIKLKVENTLRWRWAKDALGQDLTATQIKESNSRVIRWSDGTLSLRLGKELFDISQSIDTSATVPRQTLGVDRAASQSQSQSQIPTPQPTVPPTPGKSQGLTYLVAQHKRSQVLQAEAVVTGYLSLRPTGMQSETHRMLVRAVEQRHKQIARLRIAPEPTTDPARAVLDLAKASARRASRRAAERGDGGRGARRKPKRSKDHDVMWSDDDDDGERGDMYGDGSEEDEYEGIGLGSSPRKAKRGKAGGEEKAEEEYRADGFVVPDESDEDADGGGGGAHRRKRARGGSDAEDDLERMEASLEKQAAAEKKGQKGKKAARDEDESEDAGAMDVESEEEEEEFKVRRVTSKRIAHENDDEDEYE